LFLFDIQEDQIEHLVKFAEAGKGVVQMASPMIRARLEAINDQPFSRSDKAALTREEERENRSRNRGFNLSYREELSPSERLIEGQLWSTNYKGKGLPEISIERRFAERLKIKLGDHLRFDIQDVPVEGQVTSLRSVRWSSFQPNFFVQFQPGAIDDAPKTFIVSLKIASGSDPDQKGQLQADLVKRFPNVSMIDVSQLVARLSSIVQQMALAMRAMALLTILVGLVIFYAILMRKMKTLRFQTNLLRCLGSPRQYVLSVVMGETVALTFFAAVIGSLLALVVAGCFSVFVFEVAPKFDWTIWLLTLFGFFVFCLAIFAFGVRRVLRSNPRELLQGSESL